MAAKKNSLVANINRRKKAGKSRPKSGSTVSSASYDRMEKGWPEGGAKGKAAKKSAAKKATAKKSAAKKSAAKKTPAKKSAAKKTPAKKSAAKKTLAKKRAR